LKDQASLEANNAALLAENLIAKQQIDLFKRQLHDGYKINRELQSES